MLRNVYLFATIAVCVVKENLLQLCALLMMLFF